MLRTFAILSAVICLQLTPQAEADVNVELVNPQKFTDIRGTNQSKKRSTKNFERHIGKFVKSHAEKVVKSGHHLKLEITDVDRAGRIVYGRSAGIRPIRVMDGPVNVSMKVRYQLLDENMEVIKQGEQYLKDTFFRNAASPIKSRRDGFRYEKQLVNDWLNELY